MNLTLLTRITLFLIIMNSGGIPLIKNLYITILTLIILILIILRKRSYTYSLPAIGTAIISLLLGINILFTFDGMPDKTYIIYFLYFLTAFLYISLYKIKNNFINDLEIILSLFLYIALFSLLIQFFTKDLSIYSFNGSEYQAKTFKMLAFYPIIDTNHIFLRIQGLFWEPGILQLYMNILFFISVFIRKNTPISILSALIVFSTFSTTGLLIFISQLLMLAFKLKKLSLTKKILLIPLLLSIGSGLFFVFKDNLDDKLEGSSARSSYGRTYDLITGANIILEYPLFGIGVNEDKYHALKSKFGYANTELTDEEIYRSGSGGTNAILKLGFQFGIPTTLLFLLFFYKQRFIPTQHQLFFFILFISLLSEPIFMSPFILIYVASGMETIILLFKQKLLLKR